MAKLWLDEQVDVSGENVHYSWMLTAPYHLRSLYERHGWKWIPGHRCRGCFVTNDLEAAQFMADAHGLQVRSNGTHAIHGLPLKLETY